MQELYNKLKKYSLEDIIKIEESDRQFLALKKLYNNIKNKNIYLFLIISNALICYQLSGKGEDYWEEFSEYFLKNKVDKNNLIEKLQIFIENSKNNRRFLNIKIKRLKKIKSYLIIFLGNEKYYYDNMGKLRDDLSKIMNQKKEAKTIVFSIKMFSYGARNIYNEINYFPKNIEIPIDSRLVALFEKYRGDYQDIKKFYFDLSKKLDIPELHLDALLWVNYNKLIK